MQLQALLDWLSRHGVRLPAFQISPDQRAGRVVYAAADLRKGEEVLSVPHAAIVTLDAARRSSIGRQMRAADMDLPSGHSFLAAHLLAERRRPTSPFTPYLDILPTSFPTVPLFFHKELLPVLKGSFAAHLMVRRRESLIQDFAVLRAKVPAFRHVPLRDYVWARTVVVTRVFGVKIRGASTEVLVPLGDMLNHKRPPDVDWTFDDERDAFVMTAARDIRRGEEMCDSYGRKPNGRFFVHYGFALESGADDEVQLHLAPTKDDPRNGAKADILRRIGGATGEYRVSNKLRNDDTERAFTYLRAACASGSELARASRLVTDNKPIPPLSQRNESAALQLLGRACEEALSRFDRPDDSDDAEMLATPDLPLNVRNAVLVRRGEKRLLRSFRTLVRDSLPLLRLPRREFFSAALHHKGESLTCAYLLEIALALAPREARPPSFRSIGL